MGDLIALVNRNIKIYFKDKALFFSSLVTPLILLILFATFLREVYVNSFNASLAANGAQLDQKVINGVVGGQLVASLIAVSAVTVSFNANLVMVQDKALGRLKDLLITPVARWKISISYFIATVVGSVIVLGVTLVAGFIYLAVTGWYLTAVDVIFIIFDTLLLILFGTSFACIINSFLSTQGQMSAISTLISTAYGFISGAYMPLASFSEGIRNAVSFLPGTYGTVIVKSHFITGATDEMANLGFPSEVVKGIRDSIDANFYLFDKVVSTGAQYAVLIGSTVLFVAAFILITKMKKPKKQ